MNTTTVTPFATFDKAKATKAECLASAAKFLELALKNETDANSETNDMNKAAKMKLCDRSLNIACERELLAFDGRG